MAPMTTIRCMITKMTCMTNIGHNHEVESKAMKTGIHTEQGISMGTHRLETTTITMTICGDRKQGYLPFLLLFFLSQLFCSVRIPLLCVNSGPSCNFVH